ncbi:[Fe-Fe] hydrogenase large subunit C-terminal domain-containing protein [Lentimicrobium sp.]|jgi:iron only hydrogenase large subunit-like protein|uniref:[Fe-Fe] hydrogenase large subunit C-terminal domain-containing protein n=1 Tax=Lentimicrobium sp. TaxID=2034841 RepID=UPI0025E72F71|nr:[Fe-Fe] hydrogenase large subunit C-terminal domain-containing protein [Lentimicrobium sp.]MCO5256524.1 4Fe-4S binding protein [Lentimicrobium sp.]HPF64445.1 [Fe-Fe] hydrogenase large subunit C-terminal domain-containing protein [Lentimicrobium sp.]HPJ62043.1 [Fe-Fe] hydrogenase large subunit C-terminal domain-containing protein [Lentimicrobium sp.]HPR25746.1 [Fe-Fe] hydrogenase large subunit C-terminal domain-containing protein [Lentimicrobium sp.]HRW69159.1 [Fe-Fe] hydrogenase large subun
MESATFHHALKIREDLCIGCSHCMNVCPTEAIRVKNGKSVLIENRCVDCGECFRVCPVSAIIIDHDDFNYIFDYKYRVALVPSVFTGQFPEDISLRQIHSVLLELGFTHVYEVENGVDIVAEAINAYAGRVKDKKPLISSFCPAIVRLIQVKFPALVDHIMLLKPPLDVSALHIRHELLEQGIPAEETGIFYVTPCAAKIAAIKDPVGEKDSPITGVINMDILFSKVYRQVKQRNMQSCALPVGNRLSKKATCWSLTNGEAPFVKGRSLAIDEIHNVIEFLERLENEEISDIDFLELRACDESCAGGVLTIANRFLTAERLRNHPEDSHPGTENKHPDAARPISSNREFLLDNIGIGEIKPRSMMKLDENMAEAMRKMEKVNRIMQLLPMVDCGICGAPSCQALAQDIAQGDATINNCIFIQKILEQKGELSLEESIKIMQDIWGFGKTNKYRDLKGI